MRALLAVSLVSLQFAASRASDATADYSLDSSIDPCVETGQHKIKNMIVSMLQKPKLPEPPKWPKDSLEDEGTPMYAELQKLPESQRWKAIGLLKAFHPTYFAETLAKEWRDNMFCNFKRMECMSIDDISTPQESLSGVRAWYALYDALPDDQKPLVNNLIAELRKTVIEPTLYNYFKIFVEPSKNLIESRIPKGYPYDPIPSMPSPVEGDWNVEYKYPTVGTATLPTPNGPAYHSGMKPGYSLVQMADKSRQRCNTMSTEAKKIMCHLDFATVMTKLERSMKKRGELPTFTKSQEDNILASFAQIDAKMAAMKEVTLGACKKAKEV